MSVYDVLCIVVLCPRLQLQVHELVAFVIPSSNHINEPYNEASYTYAAVTILLFGFSPDRANPPMHLRHGQRSSLSFRRQVYEATFAAPDRDRPVKRSSVLSWLFHDHGLDSLVHQMPW